MEEYLIDYDKFTSVINEIAKTKAYSNDNLPWSTLRQYIIRRIYDIVRTHCENPAYSKIVNPLEKVEITVLELTHRICDYLNCQFSDSAPFTIHRLAEVLIDESLYSNIGKYLKSLETLVFVQSTVDDFEFLHHDGNSDSDDLNPGQTIEMEPIPWITEEQLKEIEKEAEENVRTPEDRNGAVGLEEVKEIAEEI